MNKLMTALLIIICFNCQAQDSERFNLGFENQSEDQPLANGWFKWGNYDITLSDTTYSGEKSGKIKSDQAGQSFGSIAYNIPANYSGKKIKLEGFMKIRNVENGSAGLLLRIDGNGNTLEFDKMQDQNVTGTRDWQKYSITLKYPEEAENIIVAGILMGKGEAWFDDFTLSIDGKNIQS